MTIAQMHHMGGITHNDVKPANWVVNKRDERHKRQTGSMFEFTLVDFGSSTTNDVRRSVKGWHPFSSRETEVCLVH